MQERRSGYEYGARTLVLCAALCATACSKSSTSANQGGSSGIAPGASGGSAGAAAGTAGVSAGTAGVATGTGGVTTGSAGTAGGAGAGTPSCPQCVDMPVSFGFTGGNVAATDLSAFAPCGHYVHSRMMSGSSAAPVQCQNEAPCSGANTITPGMVKDALANVDVKQALAAGLLYGVDTTPSDGSLYQFRAGYDTVKVGAPCSGQAGCKPIPAGVQALVDLLKALDKQQLALPPCSTAF